MINPDIYIMAVGAFIKANPLTFGLLWALLKLLAKRSPSTEDDRILTMIGNFIKVKF